MRTLVSLLLFSAAGLAQPIIGAGSRLCNVPDNGNTAGFWCDNGVVRTVMSESVCCKITPKPLYSTTGTISSEPGMYSGAIGCVSSDGRHGSTQAECDAITGRLTITESPSATSTSEGLVFGRADGTTLATIDAKGHVELKAGATIDDFGAAIQQAVKSMQESNHLQYENDQSYLNACMDGWKRSNDAIINALKGGKK